MGFWFERREFEDPWRQRQPRFERLVTDGPDRFFIEYRSTSGELTRLQLGTEPPSREDRADV